MSLNLKSVFRLHVENQHTVTHFNFTCKRATSNFTLHENSIIFGLLVEEAVKRVSMLAVDIEERAS